MATEDEATKEHSSAEIEGLNRWEMARPVRAALASGTKCIVPARHFNVEFTCPICLGLLRQTLTVMECLHRFCSECINKCLRVGLKECPKCRIHCPSRRSLRPDPNFDAMIQKLYPTVEFFDETEEALIQSLHEQQVQERKSATHAKKRQKKTKPSEEAPAPEKKPTSSADTQLQFQLMPHAKEVTLPPLPNPTIRTSPGLTVHKLCKYIAKKLEVMTSQLDITVLNGDQVVSVPKDLTLEAVQMGLWQNPGTLVLNYRLAS